MAKVKRGDIVTVRGHFGDVPYGEYVEVKATTSYGGVIISYKGELFHVSSSDVSEAVNDD
jgi:hypothetical protein